MATRCFRTHPVLLPCLPNADAYDIYSKDYAISIATIHHLATVERRAAGVKVRSVEYHSHTSVTSSNPETTRVCLPETWSHSDLCLGHRTG
jgi:hypothetical protein